SNAKRRYRGQGKSHIQSHRNHLQWPASQPRSGKRRRNRTTPCRPVRIHDAPHHPRQPERRPGGAGRSIRTAVRAARVLGGHRPHQIDLISICGVFMNKLAAFEALEQLYETMAHAAARKDWDALARIELDAAELRKSLEADTSEIPVTEQ